jgi:alkyl hydroperoxide reductase subunit AhpF
MDPLIEITVGYSGAQFFSKSFESKETAFEYLDSLRPASKRPAHVIIEGFTFQDIKQVTEILYVPQIFLLIENTLYGGFRFTRLFFCRNFLFKDGGEIQ